MNNIVIIASELAIITGDNKYEPLKKVIDSVLNRSGLIHKYIAKSKTEEQLLLLNETELKHIKEELKIDSSSSLKDVEKMIEKQVLVKSLNENISEEQSKGKVESAIKDKPVLSKCLGTNIKQDLMMKRGNLKENKNLDKTQIKKNITINNRNAKLYEKTLYTNGDEKYNVILRGKVDGMSGDCVVETKNRSRRLFNMIPAYEKVQLNAYMFLVEKEKSIHIECYNETQNETEYDFDIVLWNTYLEKIIQFTNDNIVCHLK